MRRANPDPKAILLLEEAAYQAASPAPPNLPVFNRNDQSASAEFIRQIRQKYRAAATEGQRACLGLAASVGEELARVRRQNPAAETLSGGGTDPVGG